MWRSAVSIENSMQNGVDLLLRPLSHTDIYRTCVFAAVVLASASGCSPARLLSKSRAASLVFSHKTTSRNFDMIGYTRIWLGILHVLNFYSDRVGYYGFCTCSHGARTRQSPCPCSSVCQLSRRAPPPPGSQTAGTDPRASMRRWASRIRDGVRVLAGCGRPAG